ncbi:tetratricopeptide repeat protein [Cognatitamlana onchidii]|uniref:tetratricopeptide repeat protein n=1 Tax=Cognatitamlana onchidii TaxID=2562860 RepID=UPI0010A66DF5|nr:hypothetical protein [Algibacter onchidii]
MKTLIGLVLVMSSFMLNAQANSELVTHYEAYYKQMKKQGDVQGMINGMTHLNILNPSQARTDTLAYVYMREGKYMQALNTIGVEFNPSDSDIAIEVKAISLQAVKQPKLAIEQFNEIFKRAASPAVAYELAELNLQLKNLEEADKHIAYGLANSKDDMNRAFYESQQPYEVSLKAAFMYLQALSTYNKDTKANIDASVDILDAALKMAPNFNLIRISKNELLRQKQVLQEQAEPSKE